MGMYTIHRRVVASTMAIAATVGLSAFAVSAPAFAAPHSAAGVALHAGPASTLPNSDLKGKGKKTAFNPAKLTATAAWPSGSTSCVASEASFTITNDTKATQTITLTATGISGSDKFSMPTKTVEDVCITTGYTGVLTAKDKASGKSLKVTF
jgi:hypothetical protein